MRLGKLFLILSLVSLVSCGKNEDENTSPNSPANQDPTILIDTYEREVWQDCEGKTVVDKIARRAAVSQIKMNPARNFRIDGAVFFNHEGAVEYNSQPLLPGPGGDNYKFVVYCQPPKVAGCNLPVKEGENRIEYKYWSYEYKPCKENPSVTCKYDILEENETKVIRFTHKSVQSDKVCKRIPNRCPLDTSTTWGECKY